MPFGLCNVAQTFQRFITEVARGLTFVFACTDDLLLFSRSSEEHEHYLCHLFQCLAEYDLVINVQKSRFGESELDFLGPQNYTTRYPAP